MTFVFLQALLHVAALVLGAGFVIVGLVAHRPPAPSRPQIISKRVLKMSTSYQLGYTLTTPVSTAPDVTTFHVETTINNGPAAVTQLPIGAPIPEIVVNPGDTLHVIFRLVDREGGVSDPSEALAVTAETVPPPQPEPPEVVAVRKIFPEEPPVTPVTPVTPVVNPT